MRGKVTDIFLRVGDRVYFEEKKIEDDFYNVELIDVVEGVITSFHVEKSMFRRERRKIYAVVQVDQSKFVVKEINEINKILK